MYPPQRDDRGVERLELLLLLLLALAAIEQASIWWGNFPSYS